MKKNNAPDPSQLFHLVLPFGDALAEAPFDPDCPHCRELAELEKLGLVKPTRIDLSEFGDELAHWPNAPS